MHLLLSGILEFKFSKENDTCPYVPDSMSMFMQVGLGASELTWASESGHRREWRLLRFTQLWSEKNGNRKHSLPAGYNLRQ